MALHWWCKLHWLNVESCVCNIWWVCCLFSRTSSVNKTIAQSTRGVRRSSIEIEAWIKAVLVSYNSKMCKKHFFLFSLKIFFLLSFVLCLDQETKKEWRKKNERLRSIFVWFRCLHRLFVNCFVDYICFL